MPSTSDYSKNDEVKAFIEGQNKFITNFYSTLAKKEKGNLFFSPFSVISAFSMVYIGSSGDTKNQMQNSLYLSSDFATIKNVFKDMIADYKTVAKEYELRTSNTAYISETFTVLDDYLTSLTDFFHSTSKKVDFSQSVAISKEINDAVEKETNSKIKDLVTPDLFDITTALALVNAIYFKGMWSHQFNPERTTDMPFWVTANDSVNVPMMYIKEKFRSSLIKELDARLITLDYQGNRISFNILLPEKRDGLCDLENALATYNLNSLHNLPAREVETEVYLPKFKLEETINLIPVLKEMGVTDLFTGESDLSGISGKKDLLVSAAIHKAFLEVNEEGSEAAAATAIIMTRCMAIRPQPPYKADHPFFFYILDKTTRNVLFTGRFVKP